MRTRRWRAPTGRSRCRRWISSNWRPRRTGWCGWRSTSTRWRARIMRIAIVATRNLLPGARSGSGCSCCSRRGDGSRDRLDRPRAAARRRRGAGVRRAGLPAVAGRVPGRVGGRPREGRGGCERRRGDRAALRRSRPVGARAARAGSDARPRWPCSRGARTARRGDGGRDDRRGLAGSWPAWSAAASLGCRATKRAAPHG